jgi:LPS-assembly lipoprotein
MSSCERTGKNKFHSRRRTLALIGSALLAAPFVSACQPLYGTTPGGARLKDVMASLEITEIPSRVGQRVRNELIFGVTGGGRPPRAEYRLEISVREWIVDTLVERTGDAKGQLYHLDAQFKLVRLTDKQVVLEGRSAGRAALDRFDPIFSNVRARIDAENRAARVVADGIKTRIAAFLSSTA